MAALKFCCMYTICILYLYIDRGGADSCPLIGLWRPTSTTGGPKQPLSSTFWLSFSRLYLLASLAAVFSSPSLRFFPDFRSFPLPLLLPYQLSEDRSSYVPGYAEKTWIGGGITGLRCRQHEYGQYLMWGRWQQNTQSPWIDKWRLQNWWMRTEHN